jgi:penicillin amidase
LRSLFSPNLPEQSPTDLALFPKINFDQVVIPENFFFQSLPALKNSNNWVTRSQKNSADTAMMAFDPHLEVNRLPALWFESVWYTGDQYSMGITLPGVPGFVMGRNNKLSFSFTYGFMDTFDYFIEEIEDGHVKQNQKQAGLNTRKIIKQRKDGSSLIYHLFSTERGPLEVSLDRINSQGKIKDGLYLSRSWSAQNHGSAEAINVLRNMHLCSSTDEACNLAKNLFISANWLFCDELDNIAYQQSGYLPKRSSRSDGIIPLDATEERNHWSDYQDSERLINIKNPPEGYLCTANNQILGSIENKSIKLPMASYRADRIEDLLKEDNNHNYQKAKSIQSDLYSKQAEAFLKCLSPFIPDTPSGRLLKDWDYTYREDSRAATLFENFLALSYEFLLAPVFGQKAWNELSMNSHFLADYYGLLDRILLRPQEADLHCFYEDSGDNAQEKAMNLMKRSLKICLSGHPAATLKTWKKKQQFTFSHILLGDKLPKWIPLNIGPVSLSGSRATVCQGNLYQNKGRVTTFAPSYRFITAIEDHFAFTVIPGGPSDRFWRKAYKSEIKLWRDFQYKTLSSFIDHN